ncbi:efflux RND transporter periplasmic adaptor subunit [Pannus brasiliensis CCIBt3594]|uniref:Efflux RND transporter periplasmic adaptor subunit n=1 Tax=Pannus brasiliensis CCIBt3594 TaxID=1427578 RepID=A0AAW9QNY1_9CHRO
MNTRSVGFSGFFGTSIALSFLVGGCAPEAPKATAPPAIPVKLQTLERDLLIDSSEYVGTLEARQRVAVAPRVQGRIQTIYVKEGDQVKRGQKIAQLTSEQQQQQVNAGIGQMNAAKANLVTAEAQYRQQQAQASAESSRVAQSRAGVANAEATVKTQQATLSSREADLQRARANLDLAQKDYERSRFLVREGAQSQQELDNKTRTIRAARAELNAATQDRDAARQQVEAARASLQAAKEALNVAIRNESASQEQVAAALATVNSRKADIANAEGQLGATRQDLRFNTIVAPIDGVVGDFNQLKVGDFIPVGGELTTLTNNKVLDLNVQIPVELQSRLRVGLPVETIEKDGSAGVKGQVTYISPTVSRDTQSVLVKFSFPNDGSLRDRQYTRVRVIWDRKPGLLIPTEAITSVGTQKFVFVAAEEKPGEGQRDVKKDAKKDTTTPAETTGSRLVVRQVPIQVGTIQGQAYQVLSGVKAGDRIAIDQILNLRDGTPISVSQQ